MKEKEQKNLCETSFRLFDTGVELQRERGGGRLVRWQEEKASPKGGEEQKCSVKLHFVSLAPVWNHKESAGKAACWLEEKNAPENFASPLKPWVKQGLERDREEEGRWAA